MRTRGLNGMAKGSGQRTTRGSKVQYAPGGSRAGNGDSLPVVPGAQRSRKPPKAYCHGEHRMMPTTFDDIAAGISPRCPKCPPLENTA